MDKDDLENLPTSFITTADADSDEDYDFIELDEVDACLLLEIDINKPWLAPAHPLFIPSTQEHADHHVKRWDALNLFSIENWYLALKNLTFDSIFLTLTLDDILFLMQRLPASALYISALEEKLNNALSQLPEHNGFVRLSTRSPKDSTFLFDEASTIMSDDHTYWPDTSNKQQQLVSLTASLVKAMKVATGKKIIDILQNSFRIHSDLLSLINLKDRQEHSTQIILREWVDMRPDHEFRVFVSRRGRTKSIVTAISQYFHYLYFEGAPSNSINNLSEQTHHELKHKIDDYVIESIDPKVSKMLKFSDEQVMDESANCIREYIVDIALIPSQHYRGESRDFNQIVIEDIIYTLVLIELNPFSPAATGSALFNWQKDLNTLWGKVERDYPVYAYRSSPCDNLEAVSLLPSNYETIIADARNKREASKVAKIHTEATKQTFQHSHEMTRQCMFFSSDSKREDSFNAKPRSELMKSTLK